MDFPYISLIPIFFLIFYIFEYFPYFVWALDQYSKQTQINVASPVPPAAARRFPQPQKPKLPERKTPNERPRREIPS